MSKPSGVNDCTVNEMPTKFQLFQNYPNPFNPVITMSYQLPTASEVELLIYNTVGQKIRTLISKQQNAGIHTVQWDSRKDASIEVASGVNFYQLKAGNFVQTKKMVLVR